MDTPGQYLHSMEVTIEDLRKLNEEEFNRKYTIIGIIGKIGAGFFSLSDNTSKIGVKFDDNSLIVPENLEIREGGKYRVIGEIEKSSDNVVQLKAFIIQSLENVDIETYMKVKKMKKSLLNGNY